MSSIKEFQRKITSLKSSRKITGSMKMISSVKLQKMGLLLDGSAAFRKTARSIETAIVQSGNKFTTPLLAGYKQVDSVHLLLITGDRGLCGRFNANAINKMLHKLNEETGNGKTVTISAIGSRGAAFCKRHSLPHELYSGIIAHPEWETIKKVADELLEKFNRGALHELWLIYSKRVSGLSEIPYIERLLPFGDTAAGSSFEKYLIEGAPELFIQDAARLITRARIYEAVISSVVAEHAARRSAMDNANSNCDRLINQYTQMRNRARQTVITTELNEIVTGKEALES